MTKTKVYVDGFNLYHAIDDLGSKNNHLKWVDLWALSESLLKLEDTLAGVEYLSAYYRRKVDSFKRHEQYVAALSYHGVSVHMGNFKRKFQRCKLCNQSFSAWEEKETDVHIAVKIVEDAFTQQFDKAIVISADTDLIPPINSVKSYHTDKDIIVIAPPKRKARCRALNPIYEIPKGKLSNNLLPESAKDHKGKTVFIRPTEYTPPQ